MGPIKTPENLQVNALILAQNLQIWVGVMTIKALLILAYRIIQGRLSMHGSVCASLQNRLNAMNTSVIHIQLYGFMPEAVSTFYER